MILKHEINSYHRQRYIRLKLVIFNLLMFGFALILRIFPDPRKHQVFDKNALILLEHLKTYKQVEGNWRCRIIVEAAVIVVVILMEHCNRWRGVTYYWGELLRAGEWNRRALNHPRHDWNEKKPYGGEYGVR